MQVMAAPARGAGRATPARKPARAPATLPSDSHLQQVELCHKLAAKQWCPSPADMFTPAAAAALDAFAALCNVHWTMGLGALLGLVGMASGPYSLLQVRSATAA